MNNTSNQNNTIIIGNKNKSAATPNTTNNTLNQTIETNNTNTNNEILNNSNNTNIKLTENLIHLLRPENFPNSRHRWNTNEEIAGLLINFNKHSEWLSKEVKIRPPSGTQLLYSRKKVRYRRDGYCWKKRKDGKTTREDHMKLKVQGMECIYGCYVHSAILPTFHRRCYWLLQNPDIVLVHYLNVPYPDEQKLILTSNFALWGERKEWTRDELISQLKPMFFNEEEEHNNPTQIQEQQRRNNEIELSTSKTVDSIVNQLLEKQKIARSSTTTMATNNNEQLITTTSTQIQEINKLKKNILPHLLIKQEQKPKSILHNIKQEKVIILPENIQQQTQEQGLLVNLASITSGNRTNNGLIIFNNQNNQILQQEKQQGNDNQAGSALQSVTWIVTWRVTEVKAKP